MRVCTVKVPVLGSGKITVKDGENFYFVKFVVEGGNATFSSLYDVWVPQGVLDFCADFFASSRKFLGV